MQQCGFGRSLCLCVLLASASIAIGPRADADVWYVDIDNIGGNGNGLSWDSALGYTQLAVDAASAGDEVWVAEGTYTNGLAYVVPKSGVSIYGGFDGTETARDQRDPATNAVVLDGNAFLSSWGVVHMDSVTDVTIDGLTISGGIKAFGAGIYCSGVNSTNTLSNLIITGNSSSEQGGGIYLTSSSPTITDCTITDNVGSVAGGGISMQFSTSAISNCAITNNFSGGNGGAGIACTSSASPTITDCRIWGNRNDGSVTSGGPGGVSLANSSNATVRDTIISSNRGTDAGGVTIGSASPLLENCVISGNVGTIIGGIYARIGSAKFRNCTISGNLSINGLGGGIEVLNTNGVTIVNCTITNNTSTIGGGLSVWDADPSVINTIFYNNTGGAVYERTAGSDPVVTNCLFNSNPNGDFRDFDTSTTLTGAANINGLAQASGNVDGAPSFVSGFQGDWNDNPVYDSVTNITTLYAGGGELSQFADDELAGRIVNADSSQRRHALIVGNDDSNLYVADNVTFYVAYAESYELVDFHVQESSGTIDLGTNAGAPATDFDGDPRPFGDAVDIGVDERADTDGDGTLDYLDDDIDGDGLSNEDEENVHGTDPWDADSDDDAFHDGFEVGAGTDPNDGGDHSQRIYVQPGGAGLGYDWNNALATIQEALDLSATSGAPVWVAAGTYSEAIAFASNARLYGGFDGTETSFDQRDYVANETIVDATGQGTRAVTMDGEANGMANAVLDGFTVTGGNYVRGGGMNFRAVDATNTVANCVFTGNLAWSSDRGGGAFYMFSSSPVIANCAFINNVATTGMGGAVLLYSSAPTFTGCVFAGNEAATHGGALWGLDSSTASFTDCKISGNTAGNSGGGAGSYILVMDSCTVSGNTAATGGGIVAQGSDSSTFTNVLITGNTAATQAGGAYFDFASPAMMNCTVVGNTAPADSGGGILLSTSNAAITNTIFADNTGVGIKESSPTSDPVVVNCLFYENADGDYYDADLAAIQSGASAINALAEASGNIDTDPAFEAGAAGTWTGVGAYNSGLNETVLTDADASFLPDTLVGRLIRVDASERGHMYIVANDTTSITVAGDATAVAEASDGYAVFDHHLSSASTARDAGTNTDAPLEDLDDEPRPFNTTVDVGADEWTDTDLDGQSDYADPDDDNDGLSDNDELIYGTDPFDVDTDGDGLDDGDEVLVHESDPLEADSDGDGLADGDEVTIHGTDPSNADTDGDGVGDGDEAASGTDPNLASDNIWVDFGWAGEQTGLPATPFTTMDGALGAVTDGGRVHFDGTSVTTTTGWTGQISTPMTLHAEGGTVIIGQAGAR